MIRENLNGKYLFVCANEFKEAIDFALENKLGQIQIRGVFGNESSVVTDFKEIEKLSHCLETVSFAGVLDSTIINFDSIYSLKKLKNIYIQCKQKFTLDVSQFNLKHLGIEYWKGIRNIGKIQSLESMVKTHYPYENITEFLNLNKLKILHIYSSKIETLEGIDRLNYLEELSLARNNKLEYIYEIKKIKLLNKLIIEKCKNLKDYNFVYEMENIKSLYVNGFIK
jgi:internalin A